MPKALKERIRIAEYVLELHPGDYHDWFYIPFSYQTLPFIPRSLRVRLRVSLFCDI